MHHLTALHMLVHAKRADRRADVVVNGEVFRIDEIQHIAVPSAERRLAASDKDIDVAEDLPPPHRIGELAGPVVLIVGRVHNREPTTSEFQAVQGSILIDTGDISAISVTAL